MRKIIRKAVEAEQEDESTHSRESASQGWQKRGIPWLASASARSLPG